MKTFTPQVFALLLFGFLFISCSQESDDLEFEQTNKIETTIINYSEIESEILDLINNHRTNIGLSTLSRSNIVSSVAEDHTNYMIKNGSVNHDNFQSRVKSLKEQENAISVGENIAFGYRTAEGVVNGWLNSLEHKEIIETSDFTHFGISTKSNAENKNYFTNIFIKK
jgi:uncharacterized protein YkwD